MGVRCRVWLVGWLVVGLGAPAGLPQQQVQWAEPGPDGRQNVVVTVPSADLPLCVYGESNGDSIPLRLTSDRGRAVVRSVRLRVGDADDYLVDGRIRVTKGRAWLTGYASPENASAAARRGERAAVEPDRTHGSAEFDEVGLGKSPDPHYVLIDFTNRPNGRNILQIELRVEGEAYLDELHLRPFPPRIMANPGFEMPLDRRGRIPMWSEETQARLIAGERGGAAALATESPHEGAASLSVTPSAEWFAVSSLNYVIPRWSDRMDLRAYVRCSPGASAQLCAVWTDDNAQNVKGIEQSEAFTGQTWQPVTLFDAKPPDGAKQVRIALVARGGEVRFDRAEILAQPAARGLEVAINQAGYNRLGPKRAIVMTSFVPDRNSSGSDARRQGSFGATFVVKDSNGRTRAKGDLQWLGRTYGHQGADWGWFFWRADFSKLTRNGAYRILAELDGREVASHPFTIGNDVVFQETAATCVDFFFVQRCGFDVPGWHAACHMDGAKLPDGTHRDLTGGWHSAGDYNKLAWEYGDGGVMYALINAYEAAPEYFDRFDRDGAGLPDALDEAQWGAQYLAKLQKDDGGFLKDVQQGPDRATWMKWAPPEQQTDGVPGTPDDPIVVEGDGNSPLAIGGWARLARQLEARGIPNDYLARAIRSFDYATRAGGLDSPLLLISAVDLHGAGADARFLDFARRSVETILAGGPPEGMLNGGYADTGDVPAAALAHFALRVPDDPLVPRIQQRLADHLDAFVAEPDNPLGLTRQKHGPEGYFFEPTSSYGHNFEYLCRAWSALKVYQLLGDPRAMDYALDHIDFVLGRNPYGLCMFEGKGAVNAPRYHHRYNTIPGRERGAVPGAIPNGFVRDIGGYDRPGFDLSVTGRDYPSYRTNEPWLVHNVFYLLAVSALHDAASK